jgi:hypothetical protein
MLIRPALVLMAASFAATVAHAADFPSRKAGLWEITMNSGNPGIPPIVQKVCLDKATDQLLYKEGAGASAKLCSKVDIHSSSTQVVVDSECTIGASHTINHSVTTMAGDSAYHTESTLHHDAASGKGDSKSTQDGRWTGPCPSDMRAGDVVIGPDARMPVPMKMNLLDMFKGAG